MVESVNKLYDRKALEMIFGEKIAMRQKQTAYLYFNFRCGMSFKNIDGRTIYYTLGQKY